MARRNYKTNGSEAFSPNEKNDAYARPIPQRESKPVARPGYKKVERPLIRKRVELREAGAMSMEAILGFVCVCVLAGMLMNGYAQLITSSDEVVQLRQELQELESEKLLLSAQYEKYFDIKRIEETLGDEMMLPTNAQVVYIDLSQPDSVNIYGEEEENNQSFLGKMKNIFTS